MASTTLKSADWAHSTVISGDVPTAVRELKSGEGGEIQVHGSGELLQTLIEHDLVDEYRLWVYPVVLGRGRKLFRDGTTPKSLRLVETRTTAAGVVVHVYQPGGAFTVGSFLGDD